MTEREEVNTFMIAMIGLISAILLFVFIVALETAYYNYKEKEQAKRDSIERYQDAAQLRAGQEARLNIYQWVDREKGVIAIPIDRAMALVVRELAAGDHEEAE